MGDAPEPLLGYRAYGLTLASELRLPELPEDDPNAASLRVSIDPERASSGASAGKRGDPPVVERNAAGLVLRFPGSSAFAVSAGARHIEVRASKGDSPSTVGHLLIDQVLPAALSERGELVLHASGVSLPNGAVLFVGPSGAGKSTLAAVLSRRGWPVVCDDGARLVSGAGSRPAVVPSYRGLRLWPDGVAAVVGSAEGLGEVAGGSPKRRWVPTDGPTESVALACVCLLEDGHGPPEAVPAPPREALVDILDNSYRLPGTDPARVRAQFDRAAELVETTPVVRLAYPYDFGRLEEVAELVEGLAASARSGSRSA